MRPKELSKADKDKHDNAWSATYLRKLREGGTELNDLLSSAATVLARYARMSALSLAPSSFCV